MYVTELNDCIRVVDVAKQTVFTVTGSSFLDGVALFNYPYGLEIMDEGTIVVSDSDNNALKLISMASKKEETAKGRGELRTTKSMRMGKVEDARAVVNSSALEMLLAAAREAAKEVRPSIVEMLLSYTSNPARQTLGEILGLVHVLLYGERKSFDSMDEIQHMLKKGSFKDKILNLRVESVSHQNFSYIMKQIAQLKRNDECKVWCYKRK